MRWKDVRRAAVAHVLQGLTWCLSAAPLPLAYLTSGLLGLAAFHLARRERNRTIQHLTDFYGENSNPREIRRIARDVFRHYGFCLAEILALKDPERLLRRLSIAVEGFEYIEQAFKKGKGVLFVTGHFGNWELMATYFAQRGFPINVVAREVRQPILQRLIERHRVSSGMRIHYTKGDGVLTMLRVLRRREVLALLVDIRTEGDGRWVEFLGRPAYTLTGPAVLASHSGAAVVFGYAVRIRPWHYRFVFQPPVELEAPSSRSGAEWESYVHSLLRSLNDRLSIIIQQFPEQWMWMHRRHDPIRPSRRKARDPHMSPGGTNRDTCR